MTHWDVLAVSPSADMRAIKKAYAQKLKVTRPEDDLSGFIALRQAYEAAIDASSVEIASFDNPPEAFLIANADTEITDSRSNLPNADNANSNLVDHTDPITLLNQLHARIVGGETIAAVISWLKHSDSYVNLNFQHALGAAFIEEISDHLRWPHEALKALGQLWGWLPDDDLFLDQPTTQFEALILRTWIRSVGKTICYRFFSEAKTNIAAASASLVAEIADLEPEFRPILIQIFVWDLVNERHSATTVLALEDVFGWHHTVAVDAFGAVLHRARMEHRIASMTRRDKLKRMVPRHRAMWLLKFRRGNWGVLRTMMDPRKIELQKVLVEAREYHCDLDTLFDARQLQFFAGDAVRIQTSHHWIQILLDILIITAAATIQYFMVPEVASVFIGMFIGIAIRIFMRLFT